MTKLRISPDLALPIEAVTEAIGFLGRRGSGKSYAAQKLAEQIHGAGAQFVALDPVGNWWALRLAADGKSPGSRSPSSADCRATFRIDATAGKKVADVIVDRGSRR
jgi:DNA helicase HerA-like ATPase